MNLRNERVADREAIHALHVAAFGGDAEARLVDALRASGNLEVSLCAEENGQVVGHIAFSPVVAGDERRRGLGLAPMAVSPSWQRRGVGSLLVAAGLDECRRRRARFVVVLGHPAFYLRSGFEPAAARGWRSEYGDDAPFFVIELGGGGLPGGGGIIRYGPEFAMFAGDDPPPAG